MRRLMNLLKPRPSPAPMALQDHMVRGARALSFAGIVAMPSIALLCWAFAGADPVACAFVGSASATAHGIALVVLSTRTGKRYVEPVAGALGGLSVITSTFGGPLLSGVVPPMTFAVFTPLLFAAFFPFRPRLTALLGVVSVGFPLAFSSAPLGLPVEGFVVSGISYTGLAMVANHLHRGVWAKLASTQRRLVASDRMALLGRMMAGLAHELKTPTAAASAGVSRLDALVDELERSIGHPDVDDADLRSIVADARAATQASADGLARVGRYLVALRDQTVGMHESAHVQFALAKRLGSLSDLLSHAVRKAEVQLVLRGDLDASVEGDPGKLDQVLLNLLSNAVEACAHGQGTRIELVVAQRADGTEITVVDDGPGVPEGLQDRIFEPLTTTKALQGGTGLGLAISRDIVEGGFGGTLELQPSSRGATFRVWLPTRGAYPHRATAWRPAA